MASSKRREESRVQRPCKKKTSHRRRPLALTPLFSLRMQPTARPVVFNGKNSHRGGRLCGNVASLPGPVSSSEVLFCALIQRETSTHAAAAEEEVAFAVTRPNNAQAESPEERKTKAAIRPPPKHDSLSLCPSQRQQ